MDERAYLHRIADHQAGHAELPVSAAAARRYELQVDGAQEEGPPAARRG